MSRVFCLKGRGGTKTQFKNTSDGSEGPRGGCLKGWSGTEGVHDKAVKELLSLMPPVS